MKTQLQNVRQKDKKIKPLKQPTKSIRTTKLAGKTYAKPEELTRIDKDKNIKPPIPQQHQIHTLETICTHLLQAGNIQSYIDVFYITHKCLPNVMDTPNYFGEQLHIPQTSDNEEEASLQFFSQFAKELAKAEVTPQSQIEEKEASMNQYNSIAYNYEEQGNYVTAAYFYTKVIELAVSCKNKQLELVALLGLGKCYEHQKRTDEAINLLQNALDMACALQEVDQQLQMIKLIGRELIEIYIFKAQAMLHFSIEQTLNAYERGLTTARRVKETDSEARICHKIGQLYYDQGRYQESVKYQEQYIQKLKENSEETQRERDAEDIPEKKDLGALKFKEMEANASLAKCYLKLKSIQQAEIHLNEYNRMAKEAKALNSVAISSYYLGKLLEEKGEESKAISYYQAYFEAAKAEKHDKKDRKLVDKARVTVAIAKGNKNMDKYISLFEGDDSLSKLLDWKSKRILK